MCQVFIEKAKSMKQENMLGFLGTLISSYLAKIIVIWDNAYFFQYFKQIVNLPIAKRLVCLPEYKKFFSFEITHALFQIGKVVKKLNQKQPLQGGNPNLGLKKD